MIPILSPEEVHEICERAVFLRDACLVALLYLTGRRISEVIPLQKRDFAVVGDRVYFTTFNEKSWRLKKGGAYQIQKYVYFKEYEGVVYYEKIEPQYSRVSPSGKLLGGYVEHHLAKLELADYLFAPKRRVRYSSHSYISRQRAYQILRSLDDRLWLHALRHINFTRLASVYQENPTEMHELTFHKQFESTLQYIRLQRVGEKLDEL